MYATSFHDDASEWQAFITGNQASCGTLYARYAPQLYNYGCKLHADRSLIEDCIQQLFLYLLTHRSHLSAVQNVKAYLVKAFRRDLLRMATENRKQQEFPAEGFDITISPETQLISDESTLARRKKVAEEINALPPRMKEVLFLRFYENLSFEDIAAVMNIHQKSVYKMVYKAFDKLRHRLIDFPLWLAMGWLLWK